MKRVRAIHVLLLLGLLYLGVEGFRKSGEVHDFTVYYRAAAAVRDGLSAYDRDTPRFPTLPYVYPPVLSSILVPLTLLPERVADWIWTCANLAALIGCLFLVRRLLLFHPDPEPIVIASFFLVFPFLRSSLRSGQIDMILFWLMLLAICPRKGNWLLRSGVPLGAAIAIKLYPAGAMLGWLVGRKWKKVGAVLLVTVIISLLIPVVILGPGNGLRETADFWTDLTPQLAGWKEAPAWYGYRTHHSQSISSALYRWTSADSAVSLRKSTPSVLILPLGDTSRWVLTFLAAGFWIALACVGLWKVEKAGKRPFPEKHLLQAGLVMGLIPILGPVSLKPSFITLLPVVAALFAVPGSTRLLSRVSWGLAVPGLILYLFPFRFLFGRDFSHWMEGHSDILIGTMLLFLALFLRAVRLEPGREAPA